MFQNNKKKEKCQKQAKTFLRNLKNHLKIQMEIQVNQFTNN